MTTRLSPEVWVCDTLRDVVMLGGGGTSAGNLGSLLGLLGHTGAPASGSYFGSMPSQGSPYGNIASGLMGLPTAGSFSAPGAISGLPSAASFGAVPNPNIGAAVPRSPGYVPPTPAAASTPAAGVPQFTPAQLQAQYATGVANPYAPPGTTDYMLFQNLTPADSGSGGGG